MLQEAIQLVEVEIRDRIIKREFGVRVVVAVGEVLLNICRLAPALALALVRPYAYRYLRLQRSRRRMSNRRGRRRSGAGGARERGAAEAVGRAAGPARTVCTARPPACPPGSS